MDAWRIAFKVVEQYASERSDRWDGFKHRRDDIVVSTRSKCGTTWMQMICLLLVHGTPLPAPLAELSPWLDWEVEPVGVVRARLDAQRHRRVIKTHTPLDGLPLDPDVRYIVVGRHPLDVAVSLFHHVSNIDQERSRQLRRESRPRPPLELSLSEWMEAWIEDRRPPRDELDTLNGNVHHVADAWTRQGAGNVLLVHYADLLDNCETSMRKIAAWLEIDVPSRAWPSLSTAASFESMRARPTAAVPDRLGILRDPAAFFRSGSSGEGSQACSDGQIRRYNRRVSELSTPEVLAWLQRP
jgi:hypothetical protein